jgi:hypothetical protein
MRGIIFFGTPHRGSGADSLAKSVALVVQAVQDVNIANVDRESQILDQIRDRFCRILDRRTIRVFSFVEGLAMLDGKRVNIAYVQRLDMILTSQSGSRWGIGHN